MSDIWLDVEVFADRYEDLLALPPLEDDPLGGEEGTDDTDEEASDDLPF